MQFLRTAFWVILAVAIALFCKANNRPMTVKIWGDIVWETRIWFPIMLAFLLGALPIWLVGRATKWRLKRKLDSMERALAAATAVPVTPPAPAVIGPEDSAAEVIPTAVPTAVSPLALSEKS